MNSKGEDLFLIWICEVGRNDFNSDLEAVRLMFSTDLMIWETLAIIWATFSFEILYKDVEERSSCSLLAYSPLISNSIPSLALKSNFHKMSVYSED